ncbi:MAG: hypothetical protein AAGF71_09630 [Pseudomonadota bacterium]
MPLFSLLKEYELSPVVGKIITRPSEPETAQDDDIALGWVEILSLTVMLLWAVAAGALFLIMPEALGWAGAGLPLLLLIFVFVQARKLRLMKESAATLREELEAAGAELREAQANQMAQPDFSEAVENAEIPDAQQDFPDAPLGLPGPQDDDAGQGEPADLPVTSTQEALAMAAFSTPTFQSRRDSSEVAGKPAPVAQPGLPLDGAGEAPPELSNADLLVALNFPEDPDDTDGFRALRRALKHPQTGPVISAAQDVLTLLSQVGLYMDDLKPDHARPELWRRFVTGERGGAITALGGIRKTEPLATCSRNMREDPVFRDAAHHFLQRFDRLLRVRMDGLEDADIIGLTDTRSARAFMLLGRVAGAFD